LIIRNIISLLCELLRLHLNLCLFSEGMVGGERNGEERGRGGGERDGKQRIWMRLMNLIGLLRDGSGCMIMGFMPRCVCFPQVFSLNLLTVLECYACSVARSIKCIHTLSPIPNSRAIHFLAGFDNSNDHFSEEGTKGMDEFRC
jgi:hypothetical protein